MRKIVLFLAIVLSGTVLSLTAAPPDQSWFTDFKKAEAAAKEKNQPLLLVFTRSGNPACKKFEQEILYTSKFKSFVKDKFILVYLDTPAAAGKSGETPSLAERYGVKVFPSVIVAAKDGKATGKIMPAKIDDFLKELKKAFKGTTPSVPKTK